MNAPDDRSEQMGISTVSDSCPKCAGSGKIFLCPTWIRTVGKCCPAGTIGNVCSGRTVPCDCEMSVLPGADFSRGSKVNSGQRPEPPFGAGRDKSTERISLWSDATRAKAWRLISDWKRRRSFGQKKGYALGSESVPSRTFGRRKQVQDNAVSLQQIRIKVLYAQLVGMFSDESREEGEPVFKYVEQPDPCLQLAGGAVVSIDGETGHYTMRDVSSSTPSAFATGSEGRIIDHIVGYLCAGPNDSASQTTDAAVKLLLGRSIADVEQRLVMQTMRFCSGDLNSAARLLGIDPSDLKVRIRSYSLKRISR